MTTVLWIIIAALAVALVVETTFVVWLCKVLRNNKKQLEMSELSIKWAGK